MFKSLNPGALGVRASLPDTITYAIEYGFGGIDVPMGEVTRLVESDGIDNIAALLDNSGLQLGPWGLTVDWRKDEDVFQKGLSELPRIAALAQRFGAFRVTTWVPSGQDERTKEEQHDLLLRRFRAIARILADHGCKLGLEFIGPKTLRDRFKYPFIYTAPDMLSFAREIGHNVGLLHDCWHWYTSGGTLSELRALINDDIVAVHVNDAPAGVARDEQVDNVRLLPMESGVIDLPNYLRTLHTIRYTGPVTVEPFSARLRSLPPEQAIAETAAALDKAWKAAGLSR
ncbi:MAG: sugar phosphate isomerase/epimerase [Chloroflexi bacterium]|nr:sugar phosphate isomerase/epimerase [Chloroflexota bacterium]